MPTSVRPVAVVLEHLLIFRRPLDVLLQRRRSVAKRRHRGPLVQDHLFAALLVRDFRLLELLIVIGAISAALGEPRTS